MECFGTEYSQVGHIQGLKFDVASFGERFPRRENYEETAFVLTDFFRWFHTLKF